MNGRLLVLATALLCIGCDDQKTPPNGVYVRSDAKDALQVPSAGGPMGLARRLATDEATYKLISTTNWNDRFELQVSNIEFAKEDQLAYVFDGRAIRVGRETKGWATFPVRGGDTAQSMAAALGTRLVKRKHPGHRLRVAFRPTQVIFKTGEPVTVEFRLQNTGTAITFLSGHMSRGERDQQFTFLAYGKKGARPDIGSRMSFGGLTTRVDLSGSKIFEKGVDLRKWFELEAGHYTVFGTYRLDIVEYSGMSDTWRDAWLDFATATFEIQIRD